MSTATKRVLLAEDDDEMRSLVRQVLERQGIEVREASSGVALLSCLVDEGAFDMVVTDVCMPWMSGTQVAQMARAAGFDIPMVVMTAFADDSLRKNLGKMTKIRLLEKPFAMSDLVTHARQMLGIDHSCKSKPSVMP
jgi:two-component system cell cycle sensor histidine kinase/response regulator CckA